MGRTKNYEKGFGVLILIIINKHYQIYGFPERRSAQRRKRR
jgi:hypothetical protein